MDIPFDIKLSKTKPYLHGYVEFKPVSGGALIIVCPICKEPITEFFFVSSDEWKQVTGDYEDFVICKSCYNKLKLGKIPEKNLI